MTFIAGLEIERDNYVALGLFKTGVLIAKTFSRSIMSPASYDLMVVVTAVNAAAYDTSQELMEKVPQIRRITTHVRLTRRSAVSMFQSVRHLKSKGKYGLEMTAYFLCLRICPI